LGCGCWGTLASKLRGLGGKIPFEREKKIPAGGGQLWLCFKGRKIRTPPEKETFWPKGTGIKISKTTKKKWKGGKREKGKKKDPFPGKYLSRKGGGGNWLGGKNPRHKIPTVPERKKKKTRKRKKKKKKTWQGKKKITTNPLKAKINTSKHQNPGTLSLKMNLPKAPPNPSTPKPNSPNWFRRFSKTGGVSPPPKKGKSVGEDFFWKKKSKRFLGRGGCGDVAGHRGASFGVGFFGGPPGKRGGV